LCGLRRRRALRRRFGRGLSGGLRLGSGFGFSLRRYRLAYVRR
jgi:hypothetical protein